MQKETRRLSDLYTDRYNRIKDERKLFLNTLIGLSGGTIVLSVTLLEKIAPKKYLIGFIIASWCLLGLAILVCILGLMSMIRRSQKFQKKIERNIRGEEEDPFLRFEPLVSSPRPTHLPESLSGGLFILGVLLLGVFAIINLVSR
jgi:hypothetical protein